MEHILSGRAAAADLQAMLKERVLALQAGGIVPTLATVRVGEDGADASYERAIVRVCRNVGIRLQKHVLPLGCGQAALEDQLRRLDRDPETSGILLFRPLPKALDEAAAAACIRPGKDVDCMTEAALAGVYLGTSGSWAPCTAEGCMRLLAHYGVDPAGMHAVVLGRSAVVGRPLATLLLRANATVTVCHSKTRDLAAVCRSADLLVAALGKEHFVGPEYIKPGAVVLDVGVHWNAAAGKMTGDVDFDAVAPLAGAISPVPGGVGAMTSTMLAAHVVAAAEAQKE